MKPRGGEGQNGRLKCPMGFLVHISLLSSLQRYNIIVAFGTKQIGKKPSDSGATCFYNASPEQLGTSYEEQTKGMSTCKGLLAQTCMARKVKIITS